MKSPDCFRKNTSHLLSLLWITLYSYSWSFTAAAELLRPKGVSLSMLSLYNPDKDFGCLDGSFVIPFVYVNDDYCDCPDGSDEPGTSACPNGTFHCPNAGHAPSNIPSSRVNDGICDCCDGSDEYSGIVTCVNNCRELGRAAREAIQRQIDLLHEGYQKRQNYINQGKDLKKEKQDRLSELNLEKGEAEEKLAEKDKSKAEAEKHEKEALDYYKQLDAERKKEQNRNMEVEKEREGAQMFQMLDTNEDGKIDVSEISSKTVFDQNHDGTVSVDEAKSFLMGKEQIDREEFLKTGWILFKPFLMMDPNLYSPPSTDEPEDDEAIPIKTGAASGKIGEQEEDTGTEETPTGDDADEFNPDYSDSDLAAGPDDKQEDDMDFDHPGNEAKPTEEPETDQMYDEETQMIVAAAKQARADYDEVDTKVRDLKREIQQLERSLQQDFGSENEFLPLEGDCYEYTDRDYVYKLCPFDQASQKVKVGGDIRLGEWSKWDGPEGDKYSVMLFEKGQGCWNGPARSVQVRLSCGIENVITSVSEPQRCTYVFTFQTPAACSKLPSENIHDEL